MDDIYNPAAQIAFGQARSANLQASFAQQTADAAESKARIAQESLDMLRSQSAGSEAHNRRMISALSRQVEALHEKIYGCQLLIQERDRLILEWTHSHETFKFLARDLGTMLGVDREERQRLYDELAVGLAEEDPSFANTEILKKAKARLAGSGEAG